MRAAYIIYSEEQDCPSLPVLWELGQEKFEMNPIGMLEQIAELAAKEAGGNNLRIDGHNCFSYDEQQPGEEVFTHKCVVDKGGDGGLHITLDDFGTHLFITVEDPATVYGMLGL